MKQLLWQTKTSFLNFRPKLADWMLKIFSWHCKCLHEYYSSIVVCSRCQNCSFCDSYAQISFLVFFHVFIVPRRFKNCECWWKIERYMLRYTVQVCSGAGTRRNGVFTPFPRFVLKWDWSCFKMAIFWMRSPTFLLALYPWFGSTSSC